MRKKFHLCLLVVVVSIGLVYLWIVFFNGSIKNIANGINPDEFWQRTKWRCPPPEQAGQNTNRMTTPDAVTRATPRVIALQNGNSIEKVRASVVGIRIGNANQFAPWKQGWPNNTQPNNMQPNKWSLGSGVIVNSKGYIITNSHVISNGNQIMVSVFSNDTVEEYAAKVINASLTKDLALIKIDCPFPLTSMPIGNSDNIRVGDQVIAIGNPFGFSRTVTQGIISARRRDIKMGQMNVSNLFQMDVPINPGNSGGALCNMNGELIGINVAIYSPVESVYTGISFAIPIKEAVALYGNYMDMLQNANYQFAASANTQNIAAGFDTANPARIANSQRIMPSPGEGIEELAWLGIDLVPVKLGVEVDEVEGITPMEAGLQAGDIVNAVNGVPTPDMYAVKEAIKNVPLEIGQGVVLDVHRAALNRDLFVSFRIKEWDIKGR